MSQRTTEAGHWAELAHHWALARDDRRAFEASLRSGAAAIETFAFDAALQDHERALDLWDSIDDPEAVAGARSRRAATPGRRLRLPGRRLPSRGDPPSSRRGVGRRGARPATDGDAARGARSGAVRLRRLERVAPGLPRRRRDDPVRPADRGAGARRLGPRPDHDAARPLRRVPDPVRGGDPDRARRRCPGQEGHALSTLGIDLAVLGDPSAVEVIESAIAIAREVRNADDIGRGYVNLAEALNLAGDTRRAVEVTAEGVRAADEIGVAIPTATTSEPEGSPSTTSWATGRMLAARSTRPWPARRMGPAPRRIDSRTACRSSSGRGPSTRPTRGSIAAWS